MQSGPDKREILEAAIRQHETVIQDFQEGIRQRMMNEGKINEQEYDIQTQAFNAETTDEVEHLSRQLNFANRELEELRKMRMDIDVQHTNIQRGSVVKTDRETFFVSASIERFFVKDEPFFGLSTLTPLFQQMKGKEVGETFSFGKTTYSILDVF